MREDVAMEVIEESQPPSVSTKTGKMLIKRY
jgi:hypothetical protein